LKLLGLVFLATVLGAWKMDVPYEATVHDHLFDRVVLSADGCELNVQLYFTAPKQRYEAPVAARNYYRFRGRLEFHEHAPVLTRVFGNRAPGRRVYRTTLDTSQDGCFAKTKPKLRGIDVEGCRGRKCTPKPFD
jgi:hypothetical protein